MTNYIRKKGTPESKEVTAGQGTTMQVLVNSEEAPNFALRKFVMEPHGGMPKHTNLVEHEQYIIKGSAVVEIGDDEYDMRSLRVILFTSRLRFRTPIKPEKMVLSLFAWFQTEKTKLKS